MAQKFIPRNFAIRPVVSGEQSTKIHKIPVISDITNDYKLHLKIIKKKKNNSRCHKLAAKHLLSAVSPRILQLK